MGPEGSLPHSQEPATCLYLSVPILALRRYILKLSPLNKLVNIVLLNSDEHHKITAEWPVVIRRETWRTQWLYDEGIGVRFLAGIRYFSVPESVGISCGTHPASHPVRTRGHISWDKAAGA